MKEADVFTFERGRVSVAESKMIFTYRLSRTGADDTRYTHELVFPDATRAMWDAIPERTLSAFCETLSIACGVRYWKFECAPQIRLDGFSLDQQQATFWNTLYTKGLGEFFYRARKDFRGLVSFPYTRSHAVDVPEFPRADRALVAQGGGKDSIVTAEALKHLNVPFSTFVIGRTAMQDRVVREIGQPTISVIRTSDPVVRARRLARIGFEGYPSVSIDMFIGAFAALLHDYTYVVFSNEQSAEFPNLSYLGMYINHQWSKTVESEMMIREYLSSYVTKDVVPFSPIHQYTEVFMSREFADLPRYFDLFSSCNTNFYLPYRNDMSEHQRAHWCGACPKCAFIFACLSAYLPRERLVSIFGKDLYADAKLLPLFERLLGLRGYKPFECVGTPNEVRFVMALAHKRGEYAGTPAMNLLQSILSKISMEELEQEVLVPRGADTTPDAFKQRYLTAGMFSRAV